MEDDSTKMVFNNCEKKVEEITLLIYSNSAESVKSAMDDVEKMWEDRISTLYIRDETSLKELNFETVININITGLTNKCFRSNNISFVLFPFCCLYTNVHLNCQKKIFK